MPLAGLEPAVFPIWPAALPTELQRRVERTTGIEPALSAWEAVVLPLNYIRIAESVLFFNTLSGTPSTL